MDPSLVIGKKVNVRLGTAAVLFMLISSLDRVNISFAALSMNRALGLTPNEYGFGAGILFAGFLAGQYPSVLWLQKVGMRVWIATCSILWAVCAAGVAFVRTPEQFYVLRIFLGAAEGGLAPGIVLYLSQFATERERARTFVWPMLAIPVSIVIGSPISGWLMSIKAPLGVASWRMMLFAEAFPALILGVAAWFYFPDTPESARWLSVDEKQWLKTHASHSLSTKTKNDWTVLASPLVIAAALLWFGLLAGAYGIMFWLPQVIKQMSHVSIIDIGWVNALPWMGALLGMYYNSAHSDRTGERFWHIAVPAGLSAIGILGAWLAGAGLLALSALLLAGAGLGGAQGAFWALPTKILDQRTLPVAVVAINIVGSAGGVIMPHLIGYVVEHSGGFGTPTALISGILLLSAALVGAIRASPTVSEAFRSLP